MHMMAATFQRCSNSSCCGRSHSLGLNNLRRSRGGVRQRRKGNKVAAIDPGPASGGVLVRNYPKTGESQKYINRSASCSSRRYSIQEVVLHLLRICF